MAQRTLRTRMLNKLLYLMGPESNMTFNNAHTTTMGIFSKSFGKNRTYADMSNQLWDDYNKLQVFMTDYHIGFFRRIKTQ